MQVKPTLMTIVMGELIVFGGVRVIIKEQETQRKKETDFWVEGESTSNSMLKLHVTCSDEHGICRSYGTTKDESTKKC